MTQTILGQLFIISGLAGAGHSSCLRLLEDAGFEAIDNLPPALLADLLTLKAATLKLAIGMDSRTDALSPTLLAAAKNHPAFTTKVIFLDCHEQVLVRRFQTTRRRHPLGDNRILDNIKRDAALLAPIKAAADVVIDTTQLSIPALRAALQQQLLPTVSNQPLLVLLSFSYKDGIPADADVVLDARLLHNPYYIDALRPLTGMDAAIASYISQDAIFSPFLETTKQLLTHYREKALKPTLVVAIGCTGGQHRSVCVVEHLKTWAVVQDLAVKVYHLAL